jgi:hypothetical protein
VIYRNRFRRRRWGCRGFLLKHVAIAAIAVFFAIPVHAQLTPGMQDCVSAMNKAGAGVALAQGKQNLVCVGDAHAGSLVGTAQTCLSTNGSAVAAKKEKTIASDLKRCGSAPSFAYTGADAANLASQHGEIAMVADLLGADLDAALPDCSANPDPCRCQKKVLGAAERIASAMRKAFVGCKKMSLPQAEDAADIAACITGAAVPGSIAAARGVGGKVAKQVAKLGKAIGVCDGNGVTAGAFPGACSGLAGEPLRQCIDQRVACRVCLSLEDVDALDADCDAFDDGASNSSCIDPSTSTTTTTIAPTTTTLPATTTTIAPTTTLPVTTTTLAPTTTTFEPTTTLPPTTTTLGPLSTLTIEFPGGGLGRVQDMANGIDCTDTCTAMVPAGTQVNLTVTSTDIPDGTFRAWRGPCTGTTSPCTIEMDDDVSVDAVFLSSVVELVLGDGPFEGTAPPDYTHSRDATLRLKNGGRARTLEGFQELRWSTSPQELRSAVTSPPFCIGVAGVGPFRMSFPPQVWDIFDVYTITLALYDSSGLIQLNTSAFNVFLSGDVFAPELIPGWDDTPCP